MLFLDINIAAGPMGLISVDCSMPRSSSLEVLKGSNLWSDNDICKKLSWSDCILRCYVAFVDIGSLPWPPKLP